MRRAKRKVRRTTRSVLSDGRSIVERLFEGWTISGRACSFPWAGTYNGRRDMGRYFAAVDSASEVQAFEATSFIARGDQVIVLGTEQVKAKRTGRSYEKHWIHAMTMKNGKIYRWREYVDTAAVAAAFHERAFNPLSGNERLLFEVLLVGEHALHGFTNRDLRQHLARTPYPLASQAEKQPGQVTRLFRRLHAHGLIAKIPRSRRWRVSLSGRRTMTTAIKLREVAYPSLFATAA
jgi:hypothetical protein